jgi:lysyl-tRNA synthetase class 2
MIEMIRQRALLLRDLRRFFDSRGFLEVQPPCLSRDCVVDAYIDPIEVQSQQFGLGLDLPATYYLQTSPEAAMKRLLAAGAPSIYSLGPVFRSGERGDLHNVEFSMLEWYEVNVGLTAGIRFLGEFVSHILGHDGYDVVTYRQLYRDSLGFDPIDADLGTIAEHVARVDSSLAGSQGGDRDLLLDVLLSQRIGPTLGIDRPVIVKNYPISQAALARQSPEDAQCAARFELFADGIELANGYDELRSADVLIERTRRCNEKRQSTGRQGLASQSALVQAMREGLPPCVGVALGVDRLLMVRTGASSIADILPFPIESA